MARWTVRQVEELAPDARSVAAARKLARPGPWSETGSTDVFVWGRCQGGGGTPYQVSVDLTGPAFRCTCPSRKFPCKHGLALLLRWVEGGGAVADADGPADFAQDWADQRRTRDRSTAAERRPPDPAAQAKRLEQRLTLMTAGMADLEVWLADLVRQGLAGARQRAYAYWDDAAARLVDAQLPGLAERVRTMGSDVAARDDWVDHLLAEAGRWWCAARAWQRRDELTAADLGNLRAFIGWPYASDELRAGETVADRWQVLGVHRTDDGRLQGQRTWIMGLSTGQVAVVLDFAAAGATLAVAKVVGTVIDTTVALHPGTTPRRATFLDDPSASGAARGLPGAASLHANLARIAGWLGENPWPDRFPATVSAARVAPGDDVDRWLAVDDDGDAVPLVPDVAVWELLARAGGGPVDLFGEIEGGTMRPLTVAVDGELVSV
jgi:hypothetical protein